MEITKKKKTEEGYEVTKTSYRTFEVLTPEGNYYYLFAHPDTMILHCSCPYGTWYKRDRLCKHMKMVKRFFNNVRC